MASLRRHWICSLCGYFLPPSRYRFSVTLSEKVFSEHYSIIQHETRHFVCLDCSDKVEKKWYARDSNGQWSTNLEVVG